MQLKPFITVGRHLRTLVPIGWGGVRIEENSAFLARDIRSHKPGVSIAQERVRTQLVGVLHPGLFRLRSRRNARKVLLAHIANAIGNPFHDRLGADGVVAERGVRGNEEIRETGCLQPQVRAEPIIGPLVLQRLSTFAANVDRGQRARQRIKSRGVDDDVKLTNREANEDFAEFVRNKIRARVKDPVVAEKLAPKDHPFGAKRIPLETEYYEAYNRDNVLLVDIKEAPIERITPKGIKTSDKEYEFDVIIYATGFDALTGALTSIDIRGEGGQTLKDKWAEGPRTYLGMQIANFPNLFLAISNAFGNYPVCAEMIVEWITDCIRYIREKNLTRIAPTPEAEEAWVEHANELGTHTLLSDANSWFMGANIPGKKRAILLYANTAPAYRNKCAEVAANGYEGFQLQ